jgi:hypothetical protein
MFLLSYAAFGKPTAPACQTAGQLMDLNLSTPRFTQICRTIVDSDPACKKIAPAKRMNCSGKASNEILSSSNLALKAFSCVKGFVWDSMIELGKFVIDLVKSFVQFQVKSYSDMYKILTDSQFRARAIQKAQHSGSKAGKLASAFLNSSAQYFAREFSRNLARHPLNPVQAVGETLLKPLLSFLSEAVQSIIAEYVPQYQCMNGPAKLQTLCKIAGDFIMPPAFVLGFMKTGARGLALLARTHPRQLANFRKKFALMNEVKETTTARRAITVAPRPERSVARMSPQEATAFARREQVVKKLDDPSPGMISAVKPVHGADYSAPVGHEIWAEAGGDLDRPQKLYNENLTRKFPELSYLLSDPDKFAKTMDERFAAQKLLTPDNPHLFDYSEVGLPLLNYMKTSLAERTAGLKEIRRLIKEGKADARTRRIYPLPELETNIAFLDDLAKETQEKLIEGKINYKDTVEMSAWFSQAVANFDTRQLPFTQKRLLDFDRALEAHVEHPIDVAYENYKARKFNLFEPDKESITVGYRNAGPGYEAAYLDKEKLGVILIPSSVEIDCDVLYRLGSRERLSIVGVTNKPILADGFNRPAYDFWLHDVRHETVKLRYKTSYLETNHIPESRVPLLNKRLDAWSLELQQDITKIEDPDVRRAAELIAFNFYHDRGYPVAPSQYVKRPYKYVEYLLQSVLTISGQGSQVKNPLNIRKASAWMENYWKQKIPEEEAFLRNLKE